MTSRGHKGWGLEEHREESAHAEVVADGLLGHWPYATAEGMAACSAPESGERSGVETEKAPDVPLAIHNGVRLR